MNRQKLKRRDYELLRTLLRLQLATTGLLQRLFFPDLRQARKRLLSLRTIYGVITPHTKGLPGDYACGGRFWRLTEAGLAMVRAEFPEEPIPDNHISRTRNASLRFFEHRQGINELYLSLVQTKDKDIEDLRSRADDVAWRGEFDVVLHYQAVDGVRFKDKTIVPDATLSTPLARYFIELDRSTETRKICKRKLLAYANALQRSSFTEQFADGLPVIVVYATQTRDRASGINEVIASCGELPFRAVAMTAGAAGDWLAGAVTETPGPLSREKSAADYECQQDIKQILRGLYEEHIAGLNERELQGQKASYSAIVMQAYEYLRDERKAG